jgi:hypothetical protein
MAEEAGPGGAGTGAGLQFDRVELASPAAARACARCQRLVGDEYFALGAHMISRACADALGGAKGGGAVARALLYGIGAAAVSAIVWYLVARTTDRELGIVAIGVGLFVGFAVRKGARAGGGSTYQALAMVLTYLAITASKAMVLVQLMIDRDQQVDIAMALRLAVTGPFMRGGRSIMGVIIIGIALYEAWKINKPVPITGPFRLERAGGVFPAPPAAP